MTTDNDLPQPPVPSDCDLRGMPFMPLDLVRLFDSDLYALSTGDEFKAAITLWGRSFFQVPAASLPDDDRILAHLSGAGANWPNVRTMAMRGWYMASVTGRDGKPCVRWFHPVVAEKAREAWQARLSQRARTEAARAARAARHNQHAQTVTASVTEVVAMSVTENVTGSKGQGQGQGQGQSSPSEKNKTALASPPPPSNAKAPGDGDGVKARVQFNKTEARKAIQAGDLIRTVKAFGGNADKARADEWTRDALGLQIGAVAAILWEASRAGEPIREPSGFRKWRKDWESWQATDRIECAADMAADVGIKAQVRQQAEQGAA